MMSVCLSDRCCGRLAWPVLLLWLSGVFLFAKRNWRTLRPKDLAEHLRRTVVFNNKEKKMAKDL